MNAARAGPVVHRLDDLAVGAGCNESKGLRVLHTPSLTVQSAVAEKKGCRTARCRVDESELAGGPDRPETRSDSRSARRSRRQSSNGLFEGWTRYAESAAHAARAGTSSRSRWHASNATTSSAPWFPGRMRTANCSERGYVAKTEDLDKRRTLACWRARPAVRRSV